MEQTKFNKSFFDKVETIKIKDPLAIALGAMRHLFSRIPMR